MPNGQQDITGIKNTAPVHHNLLHEKYSQSRQTFYLSEAWWRKYATANCAIVDSGIGMSPIPWTKAGLRSVGPFSQESTFEMASV